MRLITGILLWLVFNQAASQHYNVLDYGARNDGSEKATNAIAAAISAAAEGGGGTIYFPAGDYLTGPIHLKSNITLRIEAGAYIRFSDDFDDYLPMVQSRYEGIMVKSFSPLIYAYEVENIAIVGSGTLDGQGRKWWNETERLQGKDAARNHWQDLHDELNKDVVLPDSPGMIERGFLRPPFIQPMFSKNIRIEGITLVNSPFWTVNPEFCENVTIEGVTINNPPSPNTDGINPSSCKYVHISNCHISVGDDCITIKSGKDRDGRRMDAAAENYTITNCTMLSGHGGVVIGSEMSGGVKKITISNCVFDGTDRGIRIKSTRGRGGVVEDIRVDNVIMKNIRKEAIKLNMFYSQTPPEPVSERTPIFRNIHFSNISAQGQKAVDLIGLDEMPVKNITFSHMNFETVEGISIRSASEIEIHEVEVNVKMGPAIRVETTTDLEINGFKTYSHFQDVPSIHLKDVRGGYFTDNRATEGTGTFLYVEGQSGDILMMANFLDQAIEKVRQSKEVKSTIKAN